MEHCESLNDLSATEAVARISTVDNIDLAVSTDFWDEAAEENWDACQTAFSDYFNRKVAEYSKTLGNPVFNGGMDDTGFPDNYIEQFHVHADQLAVWNCEAEQYALSIVQEDRELPFVVSFKRLRPE